MSAPAHILVVDDLPDNGMLLRKILRAEGYQVALTDNGPAALHHVRENPVDAILLDVMMPGMDGLEVTRRLKQDPTHRFIPVLLVTARNDLQSVVAGLDAGADDYLSKPVDRQELLARVRTALRTRGLQLELIDARGRLEAQHQALEASYQALLERTREKEALQAEVGVLRTRIARGVERPLVGSSPAMRRLTAQIELAGPTEATVLIQGETGTGKELVARALHQASARASGPFIALNCGALPEGLLESELFGHEKGAFTGATQRKPGRFERAAGGTLFLDEIGDIPMSMQVRMLRVLQEREFERGGGLEPVRADVRVVAATHKDLEAMVAAGTFRQDLFYRLNVVPLRLPPLRERVEDIPMLTRHLLEKAAAARGVAVPEVGEGALEPLLRYRWPGNVRELENVVERALIYGGSGRIDHFPVAAGEGAGEGGVDAAGAGAWAMGGPPPDSPRSRGEVGGGPSLDSPRSRGEVGGGPSLDSPRSRGEVGGGPAGPGGEGSPGGEVPTFTLPFHTWKEQMLERFERAYIVAALKRHGGNMSAAGRETGVDAKTFQRKIKEYRIQRHEYMA